MDEVQTMAPPRPSAVIARAASTTQCIVPSTLTARCRRQWSSVMSSRASGSAMPACAHITSIRPNWLTHSRTARAQSSRTETSPGNGTQRGPRLLTADVSRSALLSKATTLAPSSRKLATMARPMPCAAPVTTTLFPVNRAMGDSRVSGTCREC